MGSAAEKINVHANLLQSVDVEEQINKWEACGITTSCICVEGIEQDGELYTNEKLIPVLRKYPDILVGIGRIDMGWTPTGPERVEILREHGFSGLFCTRPSYPYDNEIYYPLYECAIDMDMPLMFETGIVPPAPGDRARGVSCSKMHVTRIDGVKRVFPELNIMVSGLGYPAFTEACAQIIECEGMWGDMQCISDAVQKRALFMHELGIHDNRETSAFKEQFVDLCIRNCAFGGYAADCAESIDLFERMLDDLDADDQVRDLFFRGNGEKWLEPYEQSDYEIEEKD